MSLLGYVTGTNTTSTGSGGGGLLDTLVGSAESFYGRYLDDRAARRERDHAMDLIRLGYYNPNEHNRGGPTLGRSSGFGGGGSYSGTSGFWTKAGVIVGVIGVGIAIFKLFK